MGTGEQTDPATGRQRVVLITGSPFWIQGNGLSARTRALVMFLSGRYSLAVVYLHGVTQAEVDLMNSMGTRFELFILGEPGRASSQAALKERFGRVFNESSLPAVYLIVKTELSFMLDAIPVNGRTFLDTNDLVSNRTRSMAALRVRDEYPLTEDEEIAIMRRYDQVICIQSSEYAKVLSWLGAEKVVLAPHPVATVEGTLRHTAAVIGFVASRWHANVDALQWFIEQVWPALAGTGLRVDVYGYVGEAFPGTRIPGIRFMGFIDDLTACYAHIDIAINPVRYGAGLKIKTLEAMAHGVPAVVSTQGASGLDDLAGHAILVADDARTFAAQIKTLAGSLPLRQAMSRTAHDHVARHFGIDRCFGELARQIEGLATQ